MKYECPGLCRQLHGFSYYKNMANFEAFRWNIKLSAKLLFLKSGANTFRNASIMNNGKNFGLSAILQFMC